MTPSVNLRSVLERSTWGVAFGLLVLYVAIRLGAFSLSAAVAVPGGVISLPTTYASVDHPFHVARAEILWRELSSGKMLRWIGQHQGGYPVEFYPLGEAWLEVVTRFLSLGTLSTEGAHTLTIIALFLLPGLSFAMLARQDDWSPAVGLIALALHVSLPGSWYHGGYTELVQWGLVTNVAAAVSSILMLPALIQFLCVGTRRAAVAAALLATFAVYANPRSLLGLAALGLGAWLIHVLGRGGTTLGLMTFRLAQVALTASLLAAPQLVALMRFDDLYTFVLYSGYDNLAEYAEASARSLSWPIFMLGLAGLAIGLRLLHKRIATTSVAAALVLYVALTTTMIVVPAAANLAPQLEPTRLMPLQRLLAIYLAAVAIWGIVSWFVVNVVPSRPHVASITAVVAVAAIVLIQTRPLDGPIPDPASPAVPPVSLYSVAMSGQPQQTELEAAVRAADVAAPPGTALLVVGSALSWHQQLWAPLWTERPLFYDNWLWYWRPDHAGTPGYVFWDGHHYPDPEHTLQRQYLDTHGIGAVIITGPLRAVAARSAHLQLLDTGLYEAYTVIDPVTTITFGDHNAETIRYANQRVTATSTAPGEVITARMNWHPRWRVRTTDGRAEIERSNNGYLSVAPTSPSSNVDLDYSLEMLDWIGRGLATGGVVVLVWLLVNPTSNRASGRRWYSRHPGRNNRLKLIQDNEASKRVKDVVSPGCNSG